MVFCWHFSPSTALARSDEENHALLAHGRSSTSLGCFSQGRVSHYAFINFAMYCMMLETFQARDHGRDTQRVICRLGGVDGRLVAQQWILDARMPGCQDARMGKMEDGFRWSTRQRVENDWSEYIQSMRSKIRR